MQIKIIQVWSHYFHGRATKIYYLKDFELVKHFIYFKTRTTIFPTSMSYKIVNKFSNTEYYKNDPVRGGGSVSIVHLGLRTG